LGFEVFKRGAGSYSRSGSGDASQQVQPGPAALKAMGLEELSQIEVMTPSKTPVKAFQMPAAIYDLTGEGI